MLHLSDTIAAIATPPGEGGIGIVRVAGPSALSIADTLFVTGSGVPSSLSSHTIHYGRIFDTHSGETVDDALLLIFRSPHSYTGEDIVEFSCHGGPVTLGRVLSLVLREGARLADPGEFTRRAFLNGRMDLAQAEAVCDQIRARTEAAQRIALRQRGGAVSQEVMRLKHELVGALAAVEVTIDFSEEVGELDYDALAARLSGLQAELERLISTADRGRIYREGVRIAIVGRPNVGKSSLLNALLRENRAIVTPIPGTTRDVIEESANIRGIPITAIDTAGLRETKDVVERIGVERAHAAAESASLILFVIDASRDWTEEDDLVFKVISGKRSIWVANKSDMVDEQAAILVQRDLFKRSNRRDVVALSALTLEGMDDLEWLIAEELLHGHTVEETSAVVSNVRHLRALESARDSLKEAEITVENQLAPDFISIDLRAALDALGQITGETATEDIIHRIFQDFCIGK